MSTVPAWLPELLSVGAEHLAAGGGDSPRARFKVHPGDEAEWTAEAFMAFDPSTATLRMFIRDAESGRVICRSTPVVLDVLDDTWWEIDRHSSLTSRTVPGSKR